MLSEQMGQLEPEHRKRFEALRLPLRAVPVESDLPFCVHVVAEFEGRLIYWSDIESGWGCDLPTSNGGIHDRCCNQFELRQLMAALGLA